MENLDHFVLDPIVRRLDWNLLRMFIVIVQERSLTLAANRLGLTQPAVSSALQKLEAQIGVKLIERGGKNFAVTGEGQALLTECLAVYGQIAALPARLDAVHRKITGTVNLVAASGAASDILNSALETFHTAYPDVALSINISSSLNAVHAVRSQIASLAICYAQTPADGLTYDLLREVSFGLYCGPRHRFFGRRDIDAEQLVGDSFISFQTDRLADDQWPEELLRFRRQMSFRTIGYSFNLSEVYRMVSANMGIALFPISAVEKAEEEGRLWRLPPYDRQLRGKIYLVTNPNRRWTSGESALVEVIRSLTKRPDDPGREGHLRAPLGFRD